MVAKISKVKVVPLVQSDRLCISSTVWMQLSCLATKRLLKLAQFQRIRFAIQTQDLQCATLPRSKDRSDGRTSVECTSFAPCQT